MSVTMWIVGGIIFAIYMYFTIWNINNGSKQPQQREDEHLPLLRGCVIDIGWYGDWIS